MQYELKHGDCLDVLRSMPEASVDSVVTDPPYGLAFMGKKWDYDVPSEDIWRECLRVLKPGGHLLAFAGTRTQHRMAVRIEDAGFEIRDMIAWVYGSGFPKSLDVSKAIDKQRKEDLQCAANIARWLVDRLVERGMTRKDISEHFGAVNIAQSWTTYWTDGAHRPRVPSWEQWLELKSWLGLPNDSDAEVWRLNGRKGQPGDTWQTAEVIGTRKTGDPCAWFQQDERGDGIVENRALSERARQWQGWGTALKPALEPITIARKPLVGTVAANVLTHGTGAINVDGCRVGTDIGTAKGSKPQGDGKGIYGAGLHGACEIKQLDAGRWPTNLIHDGSEEVTGLLGDAARFFYCAKASKADRDEGCEGLEAIHRANGNKWTDQDYRVANGERPPSAESGARRNHHPTVKPTALMRYLCRLVTPPNGIVLDPFMGSGSTGKAAILEGFRFIGIEREADYIEIAKARIASTVGAAASPSNNQQQLW